MQHSEIINKYWPTPSAHREYWERSNCPHVYEYDPADDGPEVRIIALVRIGMLLDEADAPTERQQATKAKHERRDARARYFPRGD